MKFSIRAQITTAFVCIMLTALLLSISMNHFLLKDFYYHKKQERFVYYYEQLETQLQKSDHRTAVNEILSKMRTADNISFIRTTSSWRLDEISENCISAEQASELKGRLMFYIMMGNNPELKSSVLVSKENYVIQMYTNQVTGISGMDSYGYFSDGSLFIMTTPLDAVQDSVSVSNQFFLFSAIGAAMAAILAVSMIAKRLTRPVLQLAEISNRMANLDFTCRYDGTASNEIALLGSSMNSMADQLENTIRQLKEANEQLQRDIEEKIQIDEVRKEFLSNVSHELKTPIALIQGYAEGLQEGVSEDPESRAYYCEVIVDEADKMNRMVRKLLTLNHLEFGQDALEQEVFDLAEMLQSLLENSRIETEKKQIQVELENIRPCMVMGDEFKIEEVCTNYISNAINHADGPRILRVSMQESEDGKQVCVTVFNTGDPIPQESLEQVWVKFYKVDKARTREYGGSGIGLSIVKAIMEAHRQPYGVYNTPEGVAFWFCLKKAETENRREQL